MLQMPGRTTDRQTWHSTFLPRKNKQEVVIIMNNDENENQMDRGVQSNQGIQSKNIFEL